MAEIDRSRLATAGRQPLAANAYRQQAPGYAPLSGVGAQKRGGRFNPPDSFPTLYLCSTRACAVAELRHQGELLPIGVAGLLPRILYRYQVQLEAVLNLTDQVALRHLAISHTDIVQRDWKMTQELGAMAHDEGLQGLLAPSATGVDDVIVVFIDQVEPGAVQPLEMEQWTSTTQL